MKSTGSERGSSIPDFSPNSIPISSCLLVILGLVSCTMVLDLDLPSPNPNYLGTTPPKGL
jgi:hypothetical protein